MNEDDISDYEGLGMKAQSQIENEQTPFLCLHFDKTGGKVFMCDSQTLQKLGEVKALEEIEDVLKRILEDSNKLLDGSLSYLSCKERIASGLSHHNSHESRSQYQLAWKNHPHLKECFDRVPTDANYDKLPTEILQGIFQYLKPRDLKSVILVSKYWKSVADVPALWKKFSLPFKCQKDANKFSEFFQMSISSKLQVLSLHDFSLISLCGFSFQLNDDHIKNLLNLELKSLTIRNIDLSNITDDYIAQLVNNSKQCKIIYRANLNGNDDNVLGSDKLKAIFKKLENGTKLKSLGLECFSLGKTLDLSCVPSSTVANAFSKLESLELRHVKFKPNQLKTVFETMNVQTKLKSLNLEGLNLESVDMKIFQSVFSNLKKLQLCGLNVDDQQLKQLAEILDKSCKLKAIKLSHIDIMHLTPGLLASIVSKVRCVYLVSLDLTVDQLEQILFTISRSASSIKQLNLYDIPNLQEINPKTLAIGINKLESFDVDGDFTEDQLVAAFKVMSQGTCLKMLGSTTELIPLEWLHPIKKVDPELLANAVHKLDKVMLHMEDSLLTLPQYLAIFRKFGLKSQDLALHEQRSMLWGLGVGRGSGRQGAKRQLS